MIFGFFSRWKKAGRAVGISNGSGKLCKFDRDGNVVSSGIDPDDIPTQLTLYRHDILLRETDTSAATFEIGVSLYTTSDVPITTFAGLIDILPDTGLLPATGSFTTPLFSAKLFAVLGIKDNSGGLYISGPVDADMTELTVTVNDVETIVDTIHTV